MEFLISEARRRHAEGTAPGRIFARLALDADPREVAVAVCVALGVERSEAERSVGAPELDPEFWDLSTYDRLSPHEAACEIGGLLEDIGIFPAQAGRDDRRERTADLLATAYGLLLPMGSGIALAYGAAVRAGRLHEAWEILVEQAERRRQYACKPIADPEALDRALTEAADLLGVAVTGPRQPRGPVTGLSPRLRSPRDHRARSPCTSPSCPCRSPAWS